MQCPKCQFENPATQNFCGECGSKLDKACPNCGSANPSQYKFCGECGHDLTLSSEPAQKEISLDEKLEKIQRYLPKGLAEKILAQRDKIEGEHKQVTVMFCDMEGYSQLSERLGPEEAYEIMDQVYEILIHKVHDYEGTVNEMTGDGIMALFGAPIAIEEAPQRAIRSAMAIHREMARFTEKIKEERKDHPTFKMRAGIHTGPVVVGIADDSGDIWSKTFAYSAHGISCFGKGFFEEALEFLFKGREFSMKLDQYWWKPWSNHFLGEVYFEIGEYQKARDHYEEAASLFLYYGNWPSFITVSKIGLARAQMFDDEKDVNLETLYGYLSLPKAKIVEGWIRRYISEILMEIDKGRILEAEDWIKEAITADRRNGTFFELARDYLVYWEILKRKGNETQASESLQKAMEIFTKCGADGWAEKYEKEIVKH